MMKGILVIQGGRLRKLQQTQMQSNYQPIFQKILQKPHHILIKKKVTKKYGNAKNAMYALQN